MATHDYAIANQLFPDTRSDINSALSAILSNNSNATAPTTTAPYMTWADTTNSLMKIRNSGDSAFFPIHTLDSTRILSKTANYTVTMADFGKVILCDASGGAFTVTLPAAATAGDYFYVTIKKTDSSINDITIDGNGSEVIDGEINYFLYSTNASVTIYNSGSSWQIASSHFSQNPQFSAYVGTTVSNITGDGTVYTVIFNTEIADNTDAYNNATGIFTAPSSGQYLFTGHMSLSGIAVNHEVQIKLVTSNRDYNVYYAIPFTISISGAIQLNFSAQADMEENDTAKITVTGTGGTATINIVQDASKFQGCRIG